jgi:pimeloyl-ACP methyl ester carboxylesterase
MNSSIGMVMVPGAGLGGWIWRDIAPLLHAPVLSLELPGRDLDVKARQALRLEDYARHVQAQVERWAVGRIVIVAHSLGGVVGQESAQLLGERVAGFVAVSAVIPQDGGSFVSSLPGPKRWAMNLLLRTVGTKAPESAIRKGLASDLPREMADEVVRRFTPESRQVYLDRTGARPPDVPKLYVKTTNDNELDSALQDRMITNLGPGKVVSLESGHLPMLSRPRELADVLNEFVSDLS